MNKLGIIVCNTYAREVERALENRQLPGCTVKVLPMACSVRKLNDSLLSSPGVGSFISDCASVVSLPVKGCSRCTSGEGSQDTDEPGRPFICTEWVIPPRILQHLIAQQKYIVTPGWLMQWKNVVQKRWGFTEEVARPFFSETAREIIVLDTGVYGNFETQLREFSTFTGLPYSIIPIGLEYFEKQIETLYYKELAEKNAAQLAETKKEMMKQRSEHMMIVDLIHRLNDFDSEQSVIKFMFEIATMFFAAGKLAYLPVEDGKPGDITYSTPQDLDVSQFQLAANPTSKTTLLPSGKGFIIKIVFRNNVLGLAYIDEILFPEFIQHYIDIGENISPLIGVLLANVKQIEQIRRAEQQAVEAAEQYKYLNQEYSCQNEELVVMNETLNNMNKHLSEREQELTLLNSTKDKFFSIISHDLRSPFATLVGLSELRDLKLREADIESASRYSRHINSVTNQTLSMLENLLKWAKMQSGTLVAKPRAVNCLEAIDDVLWLMKSVASQKDITIERVCPGSITAYTDEDMLKGVIRNLVSNAVKFTFPGGKIDVRVKIYDSTVFLKVADSGTGMDEETKANLFDMTRNKSLPGTEQEQGSGLGLILCREFVEMNGGKIWVESEPGKGSTFTFTQPAIVG